MFTNKLIATLLTLASTSILFGSGLTPTASAPPLDGATAVENPCAPSTDPTTAAPVAPKNLRLVGGGEAVAENLEESGSGPYVGSDAGTDGSAAGAYTYFDTLSARPDCLVAYTMRSVAELDSIETRGTATHKLPIVYDSNMDAAVVTIDPSGTIPGSGSTDSQQKRFPIAISSGSMLLTWDLRFDQNFAFKGNGYLGRHKTFQIGQNNDRWVVLKTDYANAAQSGVAELYVAAGGGTQWYGPGTYTVRQEVLEPSLAKFFIAANTWTRVWVWLQDIGQPVSYMSVWVADESRGPVQLYNRLAMIVPSSGLDKFWLEYDTSQDTAVNPAMRSWNRNLVVLKNVADVKTLLQRPTP